MKTILHAAFAAALAHTALAEVKITIGDITDKRTAGLLHGALEIVLKLRGAEIAEATGIRTTVKSATDDTGRALQAAEYVFRGRHGVTAENDRAETEAFEELVEWFGGGYYTPRKNADECHVCLRLENPPRTAKAVMSLEGRIEVLIPGKNPDAIITASVAKDAGKPLENAMLKMLGVQLSLHKPGTADKKDAGVFGLARIFGEHTLGYEIVDPKNKVAPIEFFDTAGKKLESPGRTSVDNNHTKTVTIFFHDKPPADAVARIYVVTHKAILTIPIALKDIPLP